MSISSKQISNSFRTTINASQFSRQTVPQINRIYQKDSYKSVKIPISNIPNIHQNFNTTLNKRLSNVNSIQNNWSYPTQPRNVPKLNENSTKRYFWRKNSIDLQNETFHRNKKDPHEEETRRRRLCICLYLLPFACLLFTAAIGALAIALIETSATTSAETMTVTITTMTTVTTTTSSASTASTSTTSTATTTTTTGPYTFYGVRINFNLSLLTNDWSVCYTTVYAIIMGPTDVSTILTTCNKSKLLLGCRPVGSSILTVAAMGNRSDVLYNCGNVSSCTHQANGVGWYFSDSYSWGFAQGGDAVARGTCDALTTNDAYRLCWHTKGFYGGYSCGTAHPLLNDTSWERVIYQAN